MADPISFVLSVCSLVGSCVKLSKDLRDLTDRFNSVPATITSLSSECNVTSVVLRRLQALVEKRPGLLSGPQDDLKTSFESATKDIEDSVAVLNREISRVTNLSYGGGMGVISRAKFMFNEEVLADSLQKIKSQRDSLGFLINYIQTEAISDIQATLSGKPNLGASSKQDTTQQQPSVSSQLSGLQNLKIKAPRPRPVLKYPRSSDIPKIQELLLLLRPKPGKSYKSTPKIAQALHSAIDRDDNNAVSKVLFEKGNPNILLGSSNLTPLQRAFDNKCNSLLVLNLVIAGANLEARDITFRQTALTRAIRRCFEPGYISLICELGADVNAVDIDGSSALHIAAQLDDPEHVLDTIKVLTIHGADLDLKDNNGRTALVRATVKRHTDVVERLLQYDADPDAATPVGRTALFIATTNGCIPIAQLLCKHKADLNFVGEEDTPLSSAIRSKQDSITRLLINSGADVNQKCPRGYPLVVIAISCTRDLPKSTILQDLLDRKADPNQVGNSGLTPIQIATHHDRIDYVKALLNAGARLETSHPSAGTPLYIAAGKGNLEIVRLLIDRGADLNATDHTGCTVLHVAIDSGHTAVAKYLIEAGAGIHMASGKHGFLPIHWAAYKADIEIVDLLIGYGSSIEATIRPGHTPFMCAVESGDIAIVQHLLSLGSDPHARSVDGGSALFWAGKFPAMIEFVIDLGVDVNLRDKYGVSALHYTAAEGYIAGVRTLLRRGAEIYHASCIFDTLDDWLERRNPMAGTPIDLARKKGHMEVVRLLEVM